MVNLIHSAIKQWSASFKPYLQSKMSIILYHNIKFNAFTESKKLIMIWKKPCLLKQNQKLLKLLLLLLKIKYLLDLQIPKTCNQTLELELHHRDSMPILSINHPMKQIKQFLSLIVRIQDGKLMFVNFKGNMLIMDLIVMLC